MLNQTGSFNDVGAGQAIRDLTESPGWKWGSEISGEQMLDLITHATADLDGQAAGKEYLDLKNFSVQNWSRMSPTAKARFLVYERYVRMAHAQGKTGMPIAAYDKMVQEMRGTYGPQVPTQFDNATYAQVGNMLNQFGQLGGNADMGGNPDYTPPPFTSSPTFSGPQTGVAQTGVAANETARIEGDPHFFDADGGKYDIQGEAGKTYDVLSDEGLAFNAQFDKWGGGNATVMGKTGLTLSGFRGTSQIEFSKDGKATLNGQPIQPGSMVLTADGGHAHLSEDGKTLTVMTGEGYTITQTLQDGYINAKIKSPASGVATDGRMPGGLAGQSFDADKLARNGTGSQGEGAIAGNVRDYEVNGGVFGQANPASTAFANPGMGLNLANTQYANQDIFAKLAALFQSFGLPVPTTLPTTNPITNTPMNLNQPGTDQSLDFMLAQANKQQAASQIQDSNSETDRLTALLMKALQMGNIDIAMLIFAALESKQATQMTAAMVKKLQEHQAKRKELASQMAGADSKQAPKFQNDIQEVNENINILTAFIKDINEQKNRTSEFANNYLSAEHQTTMSIVRGMRG